MGLVGKLLRAVAGDATVDRISNAVRWSRYCRGTYATFEEASASIAGKNAGYDNEASAELYIDRLEETRPSDYAVFFWLQPLLPGIRGVFDFGGNMGWSYYSFRKYLSFPDALRWHILDVPAVMRAGQELAKKRQAPHLIFTEEMSKAECCEVFYTSGTLQYIEADLSKMLESFAIKPQHVFVNRVPFSDRPTFFTIQDIGTAYCPYRITNRRQFIESLQQLGYTLVDQWKCAESWCSVLFRPSRHVQHYSGMYFRYQPSASPTPSI